MLQRIGIMCQYVQQWSRLVRYLTAENGPCWRFQVSHRIGVIPYVLSHLAVSMADYWVGVSYLRYFISLLPIYAVLQVAKQRVRWRSWVFWLCVLFLPILCSFSGTWTLTGIIHRSRWALNYIITGSMRSTIERNGFCIASAYLSQSKWFFVLSVPHFLVVDVSFKHLAFNHYQPFFSEFPMPLPSYAVFQGTNRSPKLCTTATHFSLVHIHFRLPLCYFSPSVRARSIICFTFTLFWLLQIFAAVIFQWPFSFWKLRMMCQSLPWLLLRVGKVLLPPNSWIWEGVDVS